MRIATYNVNGIRAAMRKGLVSWVEKEKPDVLCVQEIRADASSISTDEFESLGYHCSWMSAEKKGYSGVGIMSLKEPEEVSYGIGKESFDKEGRLLRAHIDGVDVVSVYFPNGYACTERGMYKKEWMSTFYDYAYAMLEEKEKVVISGDFNTCHTLLDIHEEALNEKNENLFLVEERNWMQKFLDGGFIDSFRYVNPELRAFSWWSLRTKARLRNHGWRMDYNMVSPSLMPQIHNAWIQPEVEHSDHCPVWVELDL